MCRTALRTHHATHAYYRSAPDTYGQILDTGWYSAPPVEYTNKLICLFAAHTSKHLLILLTLIILLIFFPVDNNYKNINTSNKTYSLILRPFIFLQNSVTKTTATLQTTVQEKAVGYKTSTIHRSTLQRQVLIATIKI